MIIQHNLQAMNAGRMLNLTGNRLAKVTEKLSSGYRINRAADNAAGLAISEKMRRQIRGLTQASKNAQDGISMVQTAEGALNEVHDMLQRMNELCVQGANDTLSRDDRRYINSEISQLKTEINRVGTTTVFNELKLLNGLPQENATAVPPDIVGASGSMIPATDDEPAKFKLDSPIRDGDVIGIKDGTSYVYYRAGDAVGTGDGSSEENAKTSTIDDIYDKITRSLFDENRKANPDVKELYSAHYLHGTGLDGEFTIEFRAPLNVKLQVGTESGDDQCIEVEIEVVNAGTLGLYDVSTLTREDAATSIDTVKTAIERVSSIRSNLGAVQNRLEHTINNLDNIVENTTAAESRIRDADMAAAMVEFSKLQILTQAGQAMLANANQSKQGVLSLIS